MSLKPQEAYQHNSVTTASPGELTLMLYNGCLKFVKQGKEAMINKNIQAKNEQLIKAQNIIYELMATLDRSQPISENILPLYEYICHRLIEANITNNPKILDEVEELVTEFRDTWKQVIKLNRKEAYSEGRRA
ncbi:flagellar protein FliS [Scopulibacillus daqui]|uniref:Flagellar secretion chaperone FliS n=1 Tax=Scopulibacillus daqui TaxID=1469162 RepID=A0ABS2PYA6_9BACL|nr:flagellar export chaperone FliS [Scopulibacillus daqui]MBM7645029.1 flagellar protein FliS [Scopulibacillus daqui]